MNELEQISDSIENIENRIERMRKHIIVTRDDVIVSTLEVLKQDTREIKGRLDDYIKNIKVLNNE